MLPFTCALTSTTKLPSVVMLFPAPVLTAMFPLRLTTDSVIVRSAAAPVLITSPPVELTMIASASPLPSVTAPLRFDAPVTARVELSVAAPVTESVEPREVAPETVKPPVVVSKPPAPGLMAMLPAARLSVPVPLSSREASPMVLEVIQRVMRLGVPVPVTMLLIVRC